jgi:hypothetical protein
MPRGIKNEVAKGFAPDPEPNKGLGHEEINYLDLKSEPTFRVYQAIEATLLLNKKYDFDMYKAVTVTEKEFNRKTGNIDDIVVGLQLSAAEPIQKTRMTWKTARELNTHVDYHNGSSKYLLLSKAPKEQAQFI